MRGQHAAARLALFETPRWVGLDNYVELFTQDDRYRTDQTSASAYGAMFAMSVLSLVPILLFFLAFQRFLVQGVATSGLKG
ncbi:hypothetical protein [Crossiella sp. NPDC003009]